jgi:ubiquinone biosynthesis protein
VDFVDVLRLPRTVQNARRVQEILAVLAHHGAADLLRRVGLWKKRPDLVSAGACEDTGLERRVRLALEDLGPTFIKLGQLLACRADVVGVPLARELRGLQDHAPAFPGFEARYQIEREFQKPLPELFSEFDEEPLAAASIAQVHRARLLTGERVAVKVRRPRLSEIVARDLDILSAIAIRIDQHANGVLPFSTVGLVDELAHSVRQEVDLRREAGHLERLARLHQQDGEVVCARVFPQLCGERVLTMEFVDGIRPDDLEALDRLGIERKEVARRLLRFVTRGVLEHGFFHADPHPGNLLVKEGSAITPIDLGVVGRIGRRERDDLLELLASFFQNDPARVVDLLDRMEILPARCNRVLLERDVHDLIDALGGCSMHRSPIARVLGDLLDTMSRHRIKIRSEFFLLTKALATIEGVVQQLAPELDSVEELKPLARSLFLERLESPDFTLRDWSRAAQRVARLLQRGPAHLDTALEQLASGRLRVEIASRADPDVLARLSAGSKRIAFALLASAGFIGSILLLFVSTGHSVAGLPLTHLLGFVGLGASAIGAAAVAVRAFASRRG